MTTVIGDILSLEHGIIVHGCNARGVMGSGIAQSIRKKYPSVFAAYKKVYDDHGLTVGSCIAVVIDRFANGGQKLVIINAITQENYGRNPKVCYVSYDAIATCFNKIATYALEQQLPVHYPLIGAGLGGGNWDIISTIIERELKGVSHTLWTLPKE